MFPSFLTRQIQKSFSDAHSPFQAHINDIQNKRSQLFPDRKRIPGRKTKYILAIAYLIHIYALVRSLQVRKMQSLKNELQRQLQRKTIPYFQAQNDIQMTTLKHRTDLLMVEAFKEKGGAPYLQTRRRFTHQLAFAPHPMNGPMKWGAGGMSRYVDQTGGQYLGRYFSSWAVQTK